MCPACGCGRTWTAGPDGFRGSRPYQFAGIDVPLRQSGFSRSVGPTDFAITLHCARKLAAPPQLGRLCRCCRESVGFLFAHNRPGDARCLVRQGHGDDDQVRPAATQGYQPRIRPTTMTMAARITATPMPLHGIPTSVLCSLNQIKWATMATSIQPERLPTSLPSAVISVETGSAPTLEQQLSSHLAVFAPRRFAGRRRRTKCLPGRHVLARTSRPARQSAEAKTAQQATSARLA